MRFKRLIVSSIAGFAVGASFCVWQKKPATAVVTDDASVPDAVDDALVVSEMPEIHAALVLARQLPMADAASCAQIALSLLAEFKNRGGKVTSEWAGLFKRWMQVAPLEAWAFVEQHHSENLPLRSVALRQWAMIDPTAAAKAAGSVIPEDEQLAIAEGCIESDPLIGLNLLLAWNGNLKLGKSLFYFDVAFSPLARQLLRRLAEISPRAAVQWCQSHAPGMAAYLCAGWMKHNAAACRAWVEGLPLKEQQTILYYLASEGIASEASLRRLASICEPMDFAGYCRGGALTTLATSDPFAAQSILDEFVLNPTDRLVVRSAVARGFSNADPRKAMEFLMPSLREELPVFQVPVLSSSGSDFSSVTEIFNDYLRLSPAAGVQQSDVLKLLHEMHPQYHSWLFDESACSLDDVFGDRLTWLAPFAEKMPREDVADLVWLSDNDHLGASDVTALEPGILRDAVAEAVIINMLDDKLPVAEVMAKAEEWGGNISYSEVYDSWLVQAPAETLQHLMRRPQANAKEWGAVIHGLYGSHREELESAVAAMPAGALRDSAAGSLASSALHDGNDAVTAIYWATEIEQRGERQQTMQRLWNQWQDGDSPRDPQVIDGVRQNIQNSALDARDKALWLERLESEVAR